MSGCLDCNDCDRKKLDKRRIVSARLAITKLHKELQALVKHALLVDVRVVLGDVRKIDETLNPELFRKKAAKK